MKRTNTTISFLFKSATLLSLLLSTPPVCSEAVLPSSEQSKPGVGNIPVKDMFADFSQEELLMAMEEGQKFMEHLEKYGSPEEKMAFQQAMEETLSNFTDEDWNEFAQIVETVQDQLPASMLEPVTPVESVKKEEKPKEKQKEPMVTVDNSFESTLHAIEKAIKSILLKATSDKNLADVINVSWAKKDAFLEMARLIQSLNHKDLIVKLTTSKNDDIKKLVESIENFKTRLVTEDKKFVIADTFGLPTDDKTTKENIAQLHKTLEFFNSAIDPLTEKLTIFLKEYEPEALKKSKNIEAQDKLALDHATKIEKMKKPASQIPSSQQGLSNSSPANINRPNSNYGGYNDYDNHPSAQDKRAQNKSDAKNSSKSDATNDNAKKADEKKNENATFQTAKDAIESYFDKYNAKDITELNKILSNAQSMYKPFAQEPKDIEKEFNDLKDNMDHTAFSTMLQKIGQQEQLKYMNKHDATYKMSDIKASIQRTVDTERRSKTLSNDEVSAIRQEEYDNAFKLKAAGGKSTKNDLAAVENEIMKKVIKHAHFHDTTMQAQAIYHEIAETINTVTPQIDQLGATIDTTIAALSKMSEPELTSISHAKYLGELDQRAKLYKNTINSTKNALRSAHNIHLLDTVTPQDRQSYNELGAKAEKVFELDAKINKIDSAMDNLQRTIRSEMAKRKRNANKVGAAQ